MSGPRAGAHASAGSRLEGEPRRRPDLDRRQQRQVGVGTTLVRRLELRVSFADDYKTRPARTDLDKHDTSFLVSLLLKL